MRLLKSNTSCALLCTIALAGTAMASTGSGAADTKNEIGVNKINAASSPLGHGHSPSTGKKADAFGSVTVHLDPHATVTTSTATHPLHPSVSHPNVGNLPSAGGSTTATTSTTTTATNLGTTKTSEQKKKHDAGEPGVVRKGIGEVNSQGPFTAAQSFTASVGNEGDNKDNNDSNDHNKDEAKKATILFSHLLQHWMVFVPIGVAFLVGLILLIVGIVLLATANRANRPPKTDQAIEV